MSKLHFSTALLLVLAASVCGADETAMTRILFGSCIKQEQPMPILETIAAEEPDLFIFLGDNIYADTEDMQVMQAKYEKLQADGGFQRLLGTCPVLATWDDHDYGVNDGGADYPKRVESQRLFVDFWKDPADSPRRQRPGVYDAQVFGPEGKRVQVLLLDTRYFRSPLKRGQRRTGGVYLPNPDPDLTMLGEDQWRWLEAQLRVPAELRVVASSIQCLPAASGQETWSNLPLERSRLLELIAKTGAEGVVMISGDRHWSELSAIEQGVPYPIHELTSSSLNQVHPRGTPTVNRFRALNNTFHRENYGALLIDWQAGRLTLQIRDIAGAVRLEKKLDLTQLAP